MMMKTLLALSLVFSIPNTFAQEKGKSKIPAGEEYKIDTGATKIEWAGKKVTGEHRGFVKVKEGKLTVKGEEVTGGNIVVDMNSMTVTDITDPDTAAKFLGHMKSSDFFDVEKYPTASLMITNTKRAKEGLELEGKLTVLGNTQPVKFIATQPRKEGNLFKARTTVIVDRTKHGLKYGSGQFFKGLGDKVIYDDFTLNIELVAKKQ